MPRERLSGWAADIKPFIDRLVGLEYAFRHSPE